MNDDHFNLLLERYLCGELNAEGLEEFERILMSDGRSRAAFWHGVKLDSSLSRMGGEAWGRLLAERGIQRRSRVWLMPAAAAAVIVALGTWLARQMVEEQSLEAPIVADEPAKAPVGVAVLREVKAAIAADGRVFRRGETLGPELLQLRSGSLRATMFSGTQVMLDAPAQVRFFDDSTVELIVGSLRAKVPALAGRLVMRLPGARVEAGESQLVAWVADGGLAGLRIDAGEVDVRPLGDGDGRRLGAGDYTLTADGQIHDGVIPALRSASPFPLTEEVPLDERQKLVMQAWRDASAARVGDPSVLLYLRFLTNAEQSGDLLANEGGHAAGDSEALVVSGNWVEGRWPEKQALLLQGTADRIRFRIEERHPKLTFSAWIQPWQFDNEFNALVMSQWGIPGEVHWQFSKDGALRFGVRPLKHRADGLFHRVFSDPLLPPEQRGIWHHLATTYDANARLVIHYLNGREVKRGTLPERIPLAFGHATIGNVTNPPPDVWGMRSLGGALDELAIFERVLSADEIRDLHQEGSPDRGSED